MITNSIKNESVLSLPNIIIVVPGLLKEQYGVSYLNPAVNMKDFKEGDICLGVCVKRETCNVGSLPYLSYWDFILFI